MADEDADGKLTYEEMFAIMTAMNGKVDSNNLKRLCELADEDGNPPRYPP